MYTGRNDDRKIRDFSLERLCVSIKHGQCSTVVINWTSDYSSVGTPVIFKEIFCYFAQSQHTNAGTLP